MSLLVLHCSAQLAAEQIRCGVALICSPGAVLANGWAGKNFIWGLNWRNQQGKGAQSLRSHCASSLGGSSSSLFFLGILFPVDLWDFCCPSASPALGFGHDAKRIGNQTHFQSFPVISSHFQWGWAEGMGMAPFPGCALPALRRCQERGGSSRGHPQHPQGT